jgi:hypothetical protein
MLSVKQNAMLCEGGVKHPLFIDIDIESPS